MKYLFSKEIIPYLESLTFTETLFAFDFDGTLAKIVKKPEDAFMSKKTSELLIELNQLAKVAIISGRSLKDIKKRVPPLKGAYIVGNHGVEGLDSNKNGLLNARKTCQGWKSNISQHTKSDLFKGVTLEDKEYSIAIHYRQSRSKGKVKIRLFDILSKLNPPPRVILGKSVINLLPAGAPHKGVALLELVMKAKARKAFFIGDDDTDEDVFNLPDRRIFTIRVGKKAKSSAPFFIEKQIEINRILEILISALKEKKHWKDQ